MTQRPDYYLTEHLVSDTSKVVLIVCTTCGKASSHKADIENRYCNFCHRFHTRHPTDGDGDGHDPARD